MDNPFLKLWVTLWGSKDSAEPAGDLHVHIFDSDNGIEKVGKSILFKCRCGVTKVVSA
jgi:hypothetical protein